MISFMPNADQSMDQLPDQSDNQLVDSSLCQLPDQSLSIPKEKLKEREEEEEEEACEEKLVKLYEKNIGGVKSTCEE
ncbi:hypothetical protein CFK40_12580 [Virgibacillus necropolis]|uniref:Uncharacterized protein n=2 Tax=Virgibacillus necropolis TaxID=163877 RepID=A0A221MDN9_9BACI|nr:hypothetical protein CFK40_12580 [Virgibacillus necropolis]